MASTILNVTLSLTSVFGQLPSAKNLRRLSAKPPKELLGWACVKSLRMAMAGTGAEWKTMAVWMLKARECGIGGACVASSSSSTAFSMVLKKVYWLHRNWRPASASQLRVSLMRCLKTASTSQRKYDCFTGRRFKLQLTSSTSDCGIDMLQGVGDGAARGSVQIEMDIRSQQVSEWTA